MELPAKIFLLEDESGIHLKERDALLTAISEGAKIVILVSHLSEKMEDELAFIISSVLGKYEKESLFTSFYSILKELVVNATKANAKKIFFQENGIEDEKSPGYAEFSRDFRENLTDEWMRLYAEKAKEAMLLVCIILEHDLSGLVLKVKNSIEISDHDEMRLREKLKTGLSFKNLKEFYVYNADQTEGEGIGLVMNLFLLKGENYDPNLFRIGNANGSAIARVEIPFSKDFTSNREKDSPKKKLDT